MAIVITAIRALELIDDAVAERGAGYKYNNPAAPDGAPAYWHTWENGDEPGCIIGLALYKAGVDREILVRLGMSPLSNCDALLEEKEVYLTKWATQILGEAQSLQDVGSRWGEVARQTRDSYQMTKRVRTRLVDEAKELSQ